MASLILIGLLIVLPAFGAQLGIDVSVVSWVLTSPQQVIDAIVRFTRQLLADISVLAQPRSGSRAKSRDSFLVGKFIAHIEAPKFGSMNRWRAAPPDPARVPCARCQPRLSFNWRRPAQKL
jgi:hypothetical protein